MQAPLRGLVEEMQQPSSNTPYSERAHLDMLLQEKLSENETGINRGEGETGAGAEVGTGGIHNRIAAWRDRRIRLENDASAKALSLWPHNLSTAAPEARAPHTWFDGITNEVRKQNDRLTIEGAEIMEHDSAYYEISEHNDDLDSTLNVLFVSEWPQRRVVRQTFRGQPCMMEVTARGFQSRCVYKYKI